MLQGVSVVLAKFLIRLAATMLVLTATSYTNAQPNDRSNEVHAIDELIRGEWTVSGHITTGGAWVHDDFADGMSSVAGYAGFAANLAYSLSNGWSFSGSLTLAQLYGHASYQELRYSNLPNWERHVEFFAWWSGATLGLRKNFDISGYSFGIYPSGGVLVRRHSDFFVYAGANDVPAHRLHAHSHTDWYLSPILALHASITHRITSSWRAGVGVDLQVSGISGPQFLTAAVVGTISHNL